jgi:predicted nucleic acid-binding protein
VIAVVDASVVIKWLLQDPEREAGTDKATRLMERVTNGEQPILQPTHWIVEVGAVLARESPGTAVDDIGMLAQELTKHCLSVVPIFALGPASCHRSPASASATPPAIHAIHRAGSAKNANRWE